MAERNPSWLDYLTYATTSKRLPTPEVVPVAAPFDASLYSQEELRLMGQPDLAKQAERLERDVAQAGILGADIERPRGLLGYLKEGAAEAIDNPVVKGLFQAMSVIGATGRQIVNTVGTVAESEINPLVWLNNRMEEYTYGRVRTSKSASNRLSGSCKRCLVLRTFLVSLPSRLVSPRLSRLKDRVLRSGLTTSRTIEVLVSCTRNSN